MIVIGTLLLGWIYSKLVFIIKNDLWYVLSPNECREHDRGYCFARLYKGLLSFIDFHFWLLWRLVTTINFGNYHHLPTPPSKVKHKATQTTKIINKNSISNLKAVFLLFYGVFFLIIYTYSNQCSNWNLSYISNNLNGDENNVFWKIVLDDSKSGSHVDSALVFKKHMKSLNKIIPWSARVKNK